MNEAESLTGIGLFDASVRRYEGRRYVAGECNFFRYDPYTGNHATYPLNIPYCPTGMELIPGSDDYLYLEVNRDENYLPVSQTLVKWNPTTGERDEIFTGEIERMMGISPDGRHIVLVIDYSGVVDAILREDGRMEGGSGPPLVLEAEPEMVVFDLKTRSQVYAIDANWQPDYDYWHRWIIELTWEVSPNWVSAGGAGISVIPIGGNQFIIADNTCRSSDCVDTLLTVTDEGKSEVELPGRAAFVLRECDQLILSNVDYAYIAYDITNQQTMPLLNDTTNSLYRVFIHRVVDERFLYVNVQSSVGYIVSPHSRCLE